MKRGRVSYCSIMYGFTQDLEFGGCGFGFGDHLNGTHASLFYMHPLILALFLVPFFTITEILLYSTCVYNVHVLMRDESRMEERSKQDQTNMAKQHSTSKAVTYKVHVSCGLLYIASCALYKLSMTFISVAGPCTSSTSATISRKEGVNGEGGEGVSAGGGEGVSGGGGEGVSTGGVEGVSAGSGEGGSGEGVGSESDEEYQLGGSESDGDLSSIGEDRDDDGQ